MSGYLLYAILISVPIVGLVALFFIMDRWGRKHDGMGGKAREVLPPIRLHASDLNEQDLSKHQR